MKMATATPRVLTPWLYTPQCVQDLRESDEYYTKYILKL